MAECRGLAPLARRHALVSTEARLARPVDIPNWSAWQDLHLHDRRFELRASALGYTGDAIGAHGRISTGASRVLSAPSLRWTTWANWYRVRDFHPQPLRSERSVSCRWTNAAKIVNRKSHIVNEIWHSRQDSRLQPPRSKRGALYIELREQKTVSELVSQ